MSPGRQNDSRALDALVLVRSIWVIPCGVARFVDITRRVYATPLFYFTSRQQELGFLLSDRN